MTARTFIYGKLANTEEINRHIGGPDNPRVFAKKSMTSSVEEHPYLVYKLGNSSSEDLAEEVDPDRPDLEPRRQYLQIWVHDYSDGETADYMKIDEVIDSIKKTLKNLSSPEDGIIILRWLETSQDLNDETLNTVMRYLRYQLVMED